MQCVDEHLKFLVNRFCRLLQRERSSNRGWESFSLRGGDGEDHAIQELWMNFGNLVRWPNQLGNCCGRCGYVYAEVFESEVPNLCWLKRLQMSSRLHRCLDIHLRLQRIPGVVRL